MPPSAVDRPRAQSFEAEPSTLIEAQCSDVVVCGYQPKAVTSSPPSELLYVTKERGAYAAEAISRMEREHLAGPALDDVGEDAEESASVFRD